MKLSCDREKLLHAFQTAASVAPSRSPKPILQNVKLDVRGEQGTLMATDLEVGVRVEVAGFDVTAEGSAVLPKDAFRAILQESSDERLTLDSDGQALTVRGSRSEFRLPTGNPDEFPTVAAFEEEKYHALPAPFFREIVRRTSFATDNQSSRYALGGVLLELSGDSVTAVATDGRRLARQQGAARAVAGHDTAANATIVPTRAMTQIDKALSGSDEEIRLAARGNDVLVLAGRTTIYSRLVEGRFPRWRDVFPKHESPARIELPAGPLLATVRQAEIVCSNERRGVDFTFADGKVVLVAQGGESGESRVEMPIAYDGRAVTITLDPRFLREFLGVLAAEQSVTLEVNDPESPAVATTEDGYAYVIMPLARAR